MTGNRPTVLIMARAPRPGESRGALIPLLGAERAALLQSVLLAEAVRWARAIGSDPIHVAHDPPGVGHELRALLGGGLHLFPQNGDGIAARLADATGRIFSRTDGPLLVLWPELPVLRPEHATAALADLRGGGTLVLGPVFDGGCYLLGLAGPVEGLFSMAGELWREGDAVRLGVTAVQATGAELGLLRAERGLRTPGDVRAALADPCLPPAVRTLLDGRRSTAPGDEL